ncbi:sodium:alanine symporter family protein [Prosthecobacter sp.]|uniref:alanine/glycine:cation symporter family protein n=1 Tax=Prosthecobacter sp. TaxID=1965333 RepID=UPI001D727BAD|nr:sodium:alanine symporter family protein [Prosthecobacter sp.]MCB1278299.1 sodium:alanine symporter family protein [Prosthecobacter sp.]
MDFAKFASEFSGFVWGVPLIVLLFGTHLFLTIRTGFIQRFIPRAIKISMSRENEGEGDVSQFGALMTALAATIGAGNIIGVAGAVATGGPGAVFWMWLTGVFGIATKYSEAVLAVKYRVKMPDGSYAGGPMYALERGLGQKWLGIVFAIFTCIAAFGIGNMFQANSVVGSLKDYIKPGDDYENIMRWVSGLVMAAITGAVILGGVKSIAKVCGFLVPIMAVGYVLGCVLILIKNAALLPQAFSDIFSSAFSSHAAVGGFAGATMKAVVQAGIARGLFSNESGLGSAPIVAAAAQTRNPVRQALVSSTATFWDTVVVCAITGLVIVSSGHWKEGLPKESLTNAAFAELHTVGPIFLLFGLMTFVFSSILGWCYYGEKAAEYLIGPRAVKPYRILWVLMVLFGAVQPAAAVMDFSDAANGLMAVPNLIALICLSGVIAAETRAHRDELTGKS